MGAFYDSINKQNKELQKINNSILTEKQEKQKEKELKRLEKIEKENSKIILQSFEFYIENLYVKNGLYYILDINKTKVINDFRLYFYDETFTHLKNNELDLLYSNFDKINLKIYKKYKTIEKEKERIKKEREEQEKKRFYELEEKKRIEELRHQQKINGFTEFLARNSLLYTSISFDISFLVLDYILFRFFDEIIK